MGQSSLRAITARILCTGLLLCAGGSATQPTYDMASETFSEQTLPGNLRLVLNVPAARPHQTHHTLVLFACPNGNTAEQTLGAKLEPGTDWHFDIQHVLAQVRFVRDQVPETRYTLGVLEAPGKSFPAWRSKAAVGGNAQAPSRILRDAVDAAVRAAPAPVDDIILMAHSGGGAALFAYLQSETPVPANVSRIVWLDADYAFDAQLHGPTLQRWLNNDPQHQLIAVAYDDRAIEVSGKKVLSAPDRGTWGATTRMAAWLSRETPTVVGKRGPFETTSAYDGRAFLALRENPENLIWHTRLVGELNGVIFGLLFPKPGVTLASPRLYERFVSTTLPSAPPSPPTRPSTRPPTLPASSAVPLLKIPPRRDDALGGRALLQSLEGKTPLECDAVFRRELLAGNVPAFLRALHPVRLSERDAVIFVAPDYLAVGSDTDYVRVPLLPATAQAVASAFEATLPTPKMVDAIYAGADLKLPPLPLAPAAEKGADALPPEQRTDARESLHAFLQHNDLIEAQHAGHPQADLVAGDKKDIVLTNRLAEKPHRVAIYGWHKPDGTPIQPLTIVHKDTYADYSHGVRLVANLMLVDGQLVLVKDVLSDPARASLLSGEGPLSASYPVEP